MAHRDIFNYHQCLKGYQPVLKQAGLPPQTSTFSVGKFAELGRRMGPTLAREQRRRRDDLPRFARVCGLARSLLEARDGVVRERRQGRHSYIVRQDASHASLRRHEQTAANSVPRRGARRHGDGTAGGRNVYLTDAIAGHVASAASATTPRQSGVAGHPCWAGLCRGFDQSSLDQYRVDRPIRGWIDLGLAGCESLLHGVGDPRVVVKIPGQQLVHSRQRMPRPNLVEDPADVLLRVLAVQERRNNDRGKIRPQSGTALRRAEQYIFSKHYNITNDILNNIVVDFELSIFNKTVSVSHKLSV